MNEIIKWLIDILPIPVLVVLLFIFASAWLIKAFYGWENYRNVLRYKGFVGTICLSIVVLSIYYRGLFHNIALIIIPISLIAILLLYYFNINHRKGRRSGLAFENIIVSKDNYYWAEGDKSFLHPFDIPASQYFYLTEIVSGADPSFSVTVRNTSTRKILLKRIGIEIICTEHDYAPQGRAGEVPMAIEIKAEHDYVVAMPNLQSNDPNPALDPFFPDNPPMNIGRLVEIGSRSILLPEDSFYAFTLKLAGYTYSIPSKALIRIWLQTDCGEEWSAPIYLKWGIF